MRFDQSKPALICNEIGQLLADAVVIIRENGFCTDWQAPVLQFYELKLLEILEKAC